MTEFDNEKAHVYHVSVGRVGHDADAGWECTWKTFRRGAASHSEAQSLARRLHENLLSLADEDLPDDERWARAQTLLSQR